MQGHSLSPRMEKKKTGQEQKHNILTHHLTLLRHRKLKSWCLPTKPLRKSRKWILRVLITSPAAEIPSIWLKDWYRLISVVNFFFPQPSTGRPRQISPKLTPLRTSSQQSLYLKPRSPSHAARLCWLRVVVIAPCDQAVCDSLYTMSLHRLKCSNEPHDHRLVFSIAFFAPFVLPFLRIRGASHEGLLSCGSATSMQLC